MLIQYGKADIYDTVDLITGELFIATVTDFGEVPIQALRKTRFGFLLPGSQDMGPVFGAVKGQDHVAGSSVEQVNGRAEAYRKTHVHRRFNTGDDHDVSIAGQR